MEAMTINQNKFISENPAPISKPLPRIFISYSHEDADFEKMLEKQLRVLELERFCDIWVDNRIQTGTEWLPAIKTAIKQADIAILMVSADFLTSPFIRNKEVHPILKRRKKKGLIVLPLYVKSCAWKELDWLSKIQGYPSAGAINLYPQPMQEKILSDFVEIISGILKKKETPNNNINKPVEEPVKIEAKEESEIEKKVQIEPEGELSPKKENEKIVEEPKKKKVSKKKFSVIIIIIAIAIAAFFFLKTYIPERQYNGFISSAKTFIQLNDLEKANDDLKKAREIKGKDTEEIVALSNEILGKRIEAIKEDFETLKKFLASGATHKEKNEKCREFLAKHQNTAGNKDTEAICYEANRFISNLDAEINAGEQYQRYIDTVNNLIKSEDYKGARKELDKAGKINNSDAVKRLSTIIAQGLETERKNGDKEYTAIKDKLTLSQYQAFQGNYPQSIHLPDLRERLKAADKNLPPEEYWDETIRKNSKGYYELTFGNEHNGHRMIYIPKKRIWIDKYEVSWEQFNKFVIDANIQFQPNQGSKYINTGNEYPAVVSFENAQNYCRRYGLRLPNADEWEYAAGKGISIYPWGNESPDETGIWRANFDSLKDGFEGTAPVKSFENFSSPFGVVNMAGNVWEFVQQNILKGGGYLSILDKIDLKIEKKRYAKPNDKEGFRCVKEEI